MNFTSWFVARTNAGFSFPFLAYFPIGALRYFSGMARALSRIAGPRRLLPLWKGEFFPQGVYLCFQTLTNRAMWLTISWETLWSDTVKHELESNLSRWHLSPAYAVCMDPQITNACQASNKPNLMLPFGGRTFCLDAGTSAKKLDSHHFLAITVFHALRWLVETCRLRHIFTYLNTLFDATVSSFNFRPLQDNCNLKPSFVAHSCQVIADNTWNREWHRVELTPQFDLVKARDQATQEHSRLNC